MAYIAGMLLELLIGLKEELQEPGLRVKNWGSVPPNLSVRLSAEPACACPHSEGGLPGFSLWQEPRP